MTLPVEQRERICHGRAAFGLLIGNVEIEFFLERHGKGNQIERVGTEIAKGCVIDDAGGGHSKMFGDQPTRALVHPLTP